MGADSSILCPVVREADSALLVVLTGSCRSTSSETVEVKLNPAHFNNVVRILFGEPSVGCITGVGDHTTPVCLAYCTPSA